QALRVVLEREGVGRAQLRVQLVPRAFVDELDDVFLGGDAAMVTAVGADDEGANETLFDVDVPALIAFFPGVGRDLQPHPLRCARLAFLFEPGHSCHRIGGRRPIWSDPPDYARPEIVTSCYKSI